MTRARMEETVHQTVDDLPEEFRSRIRNIEIVVEHAPTADVLESVGLTKDDLLFGLYIGTPLPERTSDFTMSLPDRIVIYQGDIEQACRSDREIEEEVRKTVLHELAHYFGFEEDDIPF